MKIKKWVSAISALTIAASAFAGMAVTASADTESKYALDLSTTDEGQVSNELEVGTDNSGSANSYKCNVEDFGSDVKALDGWGYKHFAFTDLSKDGRQSTVSVSASGLKLYNPSQGGGWITFTPANIDNVTEIDSGIFYYMLTYKAEGNNAERTVIGLNTGTETDPSTTGLVGGIGSGITGGDVVITYDVNTGYYEAYLDGEFKTSGTKIGAIGLAIGGSKTSSPTISDFEFGKLTYTDINGADSVEVAASTVTSNYSYGAFVGETFVSAEPSNYKLAEDAVGISVDSTGKVTLVGSAIAENTSFTVQAIDDNNGILAQKTVNVIKNVDTNKYPVTINVKDKFTGAAVTDAAIEVKDGINEAVDYTQGLTVGSYTYTVAKDGYITASGSFEIESGIESKIVDVELDSIAAYTPDGTIISSNVTSTKLALPADSYEFSQTVAANVTFTADIYIPSNGEIYFQQVASNNVGGQVRFVAKDGNLTVTHFAGGSNGGTIRSGLPTNRVYRMEITAYNEGGRAKSSAAITIKDLTSNERYTATLGVRNLNNTGAYWGLVNHENNGTPHCTGDVYINNVYTYYTNANVAVNAGDASVSGVPTYVGQTSNVTIQPAEGKEITGVTFGGTPITANTDGTYTIKATEAGQELVVTSDTSYVAATFTQPTLDKATFTENDGVWAKTFKFTVTPNSDVVTGVTVKPSEGESKTMSVSLFGKGSAVFGIIAASTEEENLADVSFETSITVQ